MAPLCQSDWEGEKNTMNLACGKWVTGILKVKYATCILSFVGGEEAQTRRTIAK